jgi:hypothetical protein
MKRLNVIAIACTGTLLAATAFAPVAQAGNVSWGVSIGVPGFGVVAGQPGYYGGRGYYGAPYYPVARPIYRPYYRPYYRAAVLVPPVVYAPRRVVYAPQPFVYGYPGYAAAPLPFSPGTGSY